MVSVMILFVFFCSSIRCPFFMSILKNLWNSKKNLWWVFLGKVLGLQHPNLLKWKPRVSVFLGITDITCWDILQNSCYIESLQITEKFCSSPLRIFQNMAYILVISLVIRNRKTFHNFVFFYNHYLFTLCVFTWVSFRNVLRSSILLSSFITCLCSV